MESLNADAGQRLQDADSRQRLLDSDLELGLWPRLRAQDMESGQGSKAQGKKSKAQGATHKLLMSLYNMHS